MSRSIHDVKSIRAQKKLVKELGWEQACAILAKQSVKTAVRSERDTFDVADLPPGTADALEFAERNPGGRLYFPASVDDMRGVVRLLPADVASGIRRIALEVGTRYINRFGESDFRDPILNRKSVEVFPGVFAPSILGTYARRTMEIQIFGYVKTADAALDRVDELNLKFHMLETLLHELAHHQDRMRRTRRGRWHADKTETLEEYAEAMTLEWGETVLIPYLAERYGGQNAQSK